MVSGLRDDHDRQGLLQRVGHTEINNRRASSGVLNHIGFANKNMGNCAENHIEIYTKRMLE
jgi:oligoribonuclease (3'-5' exoribonuclease)